jgi:hypothetical protein
MTNGDIQGAGGQQRTYSEEDVLALMNETAKRAAAEATKSAEATRFAEATKNQQRIQEAEDEPDASVINPKVVRQLKDTVAVFTALKDLSSNPLQRTIEETVGGMAASVVQSAFSPRGPPPKQDIVDKLLNSQFAYGLGSGLGQRAPELVETMGRTFGTEKASQMMDNIIGKYGTTGQAPSRQISQGPDVSAQQPPTEQKDKQSEKELLLSLDPNNPEHVSAYAETQGGLPVDVARKMLMIHQDAFIEQLKKDGANVDQISTQRGSHAQPSKPAQPSQTHTDQMSSQSIGQDVTHHDSYPGNTTEPPSNNIEYVEYRDVAPNNVGEQQPNAPHGQQEEMMKTFAADIGKVMGEMLNKIESLNNTVFTLQNEMHDIKKQKPSDTERSSRISSYPSDVTPQRTVESPSIETFEDEIIKSPETLDIENGLFEEDVMSVNTNTHITQTVQPVIKQTPIIEIEQPIVEKPEQQTVQPIIEIEQPIVEKPVIEPEPIVGQQDNINRKDDSIIPESNELGHAISDNKISEKKNDNKISEKKNDNNFITPTNKKVGIHNKATYRNVKPSFKRNDEEENKEDSNISREV